MKRAAPEAAIQVAVMRHVNVRKAHNAFICHVPNGGGRRKMVGRNGRMFSPEGATLKAMGTVSGVPDLLVIVDGRTHFLELKAAKGRLSPQQNWTIERIRTAGGRVAVAYGLDEALAQLEAWGALKPQARQVAA